MLIPIDSIEADTLRRIAEDFVSREGTDYGAVEVPFEVKVEQLLAALKRGELYVAIDEASESINLVSAEDAASLG